MQRYVCVQSALCFLNFLTSSFFLNSGTCFPSNPSWISCPKPSMPALMRYKLSYPFSAICVAYSIPGFSSKWYTIIILPSLFLQLQSCCMCLSCLILGPGQFKAYLIWYFSQSSGSLRSINRKSVSMPVGNCSVFIVIEVKLDVWLMASSQGLFQLQMDSPFSSWFMSFHTVDGLIRLKSSPFFFETYLLPIQQKIYS